MIDLFHVIHEPTNWSSFTTLAQAYKHNVTQVTYADAAFVSGCLIVYPAHHKCAC